MMIFVATPDLAIASLTCVIPQPGEPAITSFSFGNFEDIFEKYDFILCPTAPTTAYKINEIQDPIASFLGDIFTVQANIVGIPAISLPLYKSSKNMPIGIQFMAARFEDSKLLSFSNQIFKNLNNS